jgi:hypothetical protein
MELLGVLFFVGQAFQVFLVFRLGQLMLSELLLDDPAVRFDEVKFSCGHKTSFFLPY